MTILSRSLRICKYSSIEYIEAYKKYGYDNDRFFVYRGGLVMLDTIRKLIDDIKHLIRPQDDKKIWRNHNE